MEEINIFMFVRRLVYYIPLLADLDEMPRTVERIWNPVSAAASIIAGKAAIRVLREILT